MSTKTIAMDSNSDNSEQGLDAQTAPPESERNGGPLSNPRTKYWLAAGVIVVALISVLVWLHYRDRVSTDDAQVDSHLFPVASKAYGSIAEVLVNDNQKVKAGDVLVKLDPRDLQARVDQLRAALALAGSQSQAASATVPLTAARTSTGISTAETDLTRARLAYDRATTADMSYAQANIDKAQATADRARADLERMRPLAAKAEISALQFDSYVTASRVADSELKAKQEELAQAKKNADISHAALVTADARVAEARANEKQVPVRAADASAAVAAITQAKANLEAAELQLSYMTIVSPADGVVTRRSVERGQIVQQGQGLMVIVPLDKVYVTANFKETQLSDVRPGQRAEVNVDMYGKTFTGHVDSISGASGAMMSLLPPENATGNFVKVVQRIPVKIVLDGLDPYSTPLRPGMNVDATIFTK
jgi:membrane fusion protein (multidrug efflux system)